MTRTRLAGLLLRLRADRLLLAGFLIASIGGFLFLRLGSEIAEGDSFSIDRRILAALRQTPNPAIPVGPGWLKPAMIDLTSLGSATVLTVVVLLTAGYLLASGRARTSLLVVLSTAGGAMLGNLLKLAYARPRPSVVPHLVEVSSFSFPSGHAMDSAIIYLTLGALAAHAEPRHTARIFVMAAAIALTLTIGLSRLYLGVHWPSDVVGGWCVGASWAAGCSMLARVLGGARASRRR